MTCKYRHKSIITLLKRFSIIIFSFFLQDTRGGAWDQGQDMTHWAWDQGQVTRGGAWDQGQDTRGGAWDQGQDTRGGPWDQGLGSSAGRASPVRHSIFSQSQFLVQIFPRSSFDARVQWHASTSVRTSKMQNIGSHTIFYKDTQNYCTHRSGRIALF